MVVWNVVSQVLLAKIPRDECPVYVSQDCQTTGNDSVLDCAPLAYLTAIYLHP